MKKAHTIELTSDEAIILQQITEAGEEDVVGLTRSLKMSRGRIVELLERLRHKGLITMKVTYGEWWVRISIQGKRTLLYLWPEMAVR